MERLDSALSAIQSASLFLHERLDGKIAADAEISQASVPLRDARLARWRDLLGGPAALDEHIAAAGWSPAAVDAALARGGSATSLDRQAPGWLRILGRVMAAVPAMERGALPALPFGDLIAGFVAVGGEMLLERGPRGLGALSAQAVRSLRLALGESLSDILGPCLLADFGTGRPAGSGILAILVADLGSSAGDQLYRAFVERHRADGLRAFLTRYPVAGRLAATRVEMWVDACAEFLERLAEDLPEISSRLLRTAAGGAAVIDIEPRLSDPHAHGRSVAIIVFSDGRKAVYKPRSLAPEAAWRTWVREVDASYVGLAAEVIDRGTHGWMEYVARWDAGGDEGVRAFYRSAGALLCLARAFSVKDLHFENIIAAGDRPVPIDLETVAQPRPRSFAPTALDRIGAVREAVLDDSVRETEALPVRYSLSDRAPIDISAFADLGAATRRRPVWRGHATDAIMLSFEEEQIPSANLPRCDGATRPPADYLEEIVAGFEEAWGRLIEKRERIAAPGGAVDRIAGMPVRFIFRPTEIYYRLLDRALAPEKLRSGIDFSIEIEALYRAAFEAGAPPGFPRIAAAEIEALHSGDIPRFTAIAGANAVFEGGSILIDNAFERSGLASIHRRLENMAPAQRIEESRFIRASFVAARWGKGTGTTAAIDPRYGALSSDEALDAAIEIGRSIVAAAHPRADGGASWIGIAHRPEAEGPKADVVNESLYEGSTGIGVFLAALYRATGERQWAASAESALTDARRVARETLAEERRATISRLGLGFAGLGGLVYGLAIAGDLLGSEAILDDAACLASWIDADAIAAQCGSDLLGGAAGAVPGLLAIAARRPRASPDAKAAALMCGRAVARDDPAIAADDRETRAAGFGHGAAGRAATLALLAGEDPLLRNAVEGALASIEEPQQSWCRQDHGPAGWCKGPIGRAMAQLAIRLRLGRVRPVDLADVERAVDGGIADPHSLDQLCCGLFGAVDALLVAAQHGRPDLSEKARVLARALLVRARDDGGFRLLAGLPPGSGGPGFFQGTSGIGYALLRLARPRLFPSVLMTEWHA